MASLQARHTRACSLAKPWTTFAAALDGCTCAPSYFVVVRDGRRLHRELVGRNRKVAERALRKVGAAVDEGAYTPQATISFEAWAARWLAALERKQTTTNSYRSTVAYAVKTFGPKVVRKLTTADVTAFGERLKGEGLSASTRSKHLRVLSACLTSAMAHGYAAQNPVRSLPKSEKPRSEKAESAYFTNEELPRLMAELAEAGVVRVLVLTALKTGARQGELLAPLWGDVDLAGGVLRVRRSITDGHLGVPKNHERRDVDLTSDVVSMLGAWWGELGGPGDETLMFPGATASGHLDPSSVRRELYRAMKAAGIPRVGPTGTKRTFHSLRHTFAKRALETGTQITWLSRHLGHSSVTVTTGVYGHWERGERKRQALMMEGAFSV